jgi:hypothetical protein
LLQIVRLEVIAGQAIESLVGCAVGVDRILLARSF